MIYLSQCRLSREKYWKNSCALDCLVSLQISLTELLLTNLIAVFADQREQIQSNSQSNVKFIGVSLEENVYFDEHINRVSTKAYTRLLVSCRQSFASCTQSFSLV